MGSALDRLMNEGWARQRHFAALVRTTDASTEPLTTAEAKAHLRVDFADDDTLIGALITAARQAVETYTNRSLITQTWELTLDDFPAGDRITLPKGPVQSITSLKTYDEDDTESVLSSTYYLADTAGDRLILNEGRTWPTALRPGAAVKVTYVTGYGDASTDVPVPLLQAVRLLVGHFYENREAVGANMTTLPLGVTYLLRPYARVRL